MGMGQRRVRAYACACVGGAVRALRGPARVRCGAGQAGARAVARDAHGDAEGALRSLAGPRAAIQLGSHACMRACVPCVGGCLRVMRACVPCERAVRACVCKLYCYILYFN